LLLTIPILLPVIAIYLIHRANSPAIGIVTTKNLSPPTSESDMSSYSTLSTSYLNLLYPDQYLPQLGKPKSADQLDYRLFSTKADDPNASTLEIYLSPAPVGGITLSSDYKKYYDDQKNYKFSNQIYQGQSVDIISRTSGADERIALWLNSKYILVVKFSSPDKSQNISDQLKTVLQSVQWAQ